MLATALQTFCRYRFKVGDAATDSLPKNVADIAIATLLRIVAAIDIDTGKW